MGEKDRDKLEIIKELTAELHQLTTITANYQAEIDHHADRMIELLKTRIQAQKLLNDNYLSKLRHLQQELLLFKEDKAFKVIDPDNERIITDTQEVSHSEEIVQQTQEVAFIEYSSCPIDAYNNTNNQTNQDNQQQIVQSLEATYERSITEEDIDWFEAVTALNYFDSHQHGIADEQWQEIMAQIFELEPIQQCDVLIRFKDFDVWNQQQLGQINCLVLETPVSQTNAPN